MTSGPGAGSRLRHRWRPGSWSLRTRLGAVATIAATIGLCLAGSTAYAVTSKVLHEQLDDSLRGAPTAIGGDAPKRPDIAQLCAAMSESGARSPALFTVTVVRADGSVCVGSDSAKIDLDTIRLPAGPSGGAGKVRLQDGRLVDGRAARVAVISLGSDGTLLVARDATSVNTVLKTLRVTLLLVVVLGGIAVLGLSRRISRIGLRPVTQFARIAEDIAETGNLEKHVLPQSPVVVGNPHDELGQLAHAFNTMTAVLADAWARQRRLVTDAGHELRTPLSSIRSNIELLRRARRIGRPLPPGDEDRILTDLDGQVTELSQLVHDLVELSADHADSDDELVRFDQCVELALQRARRRTTKHEFTVRLEPWVVRGDAAALERAVVNLLDNAIKFSPGGGSIDVSLSHGVLSVADRGTGIAVEEKALAFDRFWRSPTARSLPGSGLGLSIVSDVAARHGGRVNLVPRGNGGTLAQMSIPAAPAGDGDPTRPPL
jgi:two-component system sensor histidine kinase MprB